MKRITLLILAVAALSAAVAAQPRYNIIPQPVSLEEKEGEFRFRTNTVIAVPEGEERMLEIAEDFAARMRCVSGMKLQVAAGADAGGIVFRKVEGMADEAYALSVTPARITVSATTPTGIFYGLQTVCQLLPAQVYGEKRAGGVRWVVPCCEIEDEPRFSYRGILLDCGRYFMPKETIFRFIDVMAMHKQNMFHWHLTQDQGWRIEIKKYPRLTEVGAWRKQTDGYKNDVKDPNPHGGFYTQDDAREVVEYARRKCVTVIPEIGLPGHATAAIAAYPELSCFPDREYEVATTWGIKKDVFCPSAATFGFLEDVFTELFDIFPSPYYNIGGDEVPRDRWKESPYVQDFMKVMGMESEDEVQIFFVRRMARFLHEKGGKQVIGWDEIIDGGYVPGTTVMSYRGHNPAIRAARLGMNTIVAANRWNYLDYYQEDPAKEPKGQGLFLPLSKVYNYFPVPDTIEVDIRQRFIGQQGCVWGEYCPDGERAEYLAFPRAVAMSEVTWCDRPAKDWDSFCRRMPKSFERMDQRGVNYSRAFWNVIFHFDRDKDGYPKEVTLTLDYPDAVIRYTTDGSPVTAKSPEYRGEVISVMRGDMIRAQGFLPGGKKVGVPVDKQFGQKEMALSTWIEK